MPKPLSVLSRLSPLLKLLAASALVLLAIDAAVFRSGWYWQWTEMQSTAGATVNDLLAVRRYVDPSRRNVLVLGDSRVGEGFSAPGADAEVAQTNLHFVNAAIPGSSPRVWNYLLRELDPNSDRYAAVVMMVDYDPHSLALFADNPLDTPYLTPLLRISDGVDYPASFHDSNLRARARRDIALPLQAMRLDVIDFILHPLARLHEVRFTRPGWVTAVGTYAGHSEALPDLPINVADAMPSDWGSDAAALKAKLQVYFVGLRAEPPADITAANLDYEREWVGRIAARYHAKGIPVIVFNIPRGPWHRLLVPPPVANDALGDLRVRGLIETLQGDAFVQFEQPQYFFDTLHMNHAGRQAFSVALAQHIATLLH